MDILKRLTAKYNGHIALYGLSTETERFLKMHENEFSLVGLLDGFLDSGELYGCPVISMNDVVAKGVKLIIVIARPGSCKAIRKRIGAICEKNDILLFDVRGNDLLNQSVATYEFRHISGQTKEVLLKKIESADIVSFDLFDTLITRKMLSYTDIFELMDMDLRSKGIFIPDFPKLRLEAEIKLSRKNAPSLEAIYDALLRKTGGAFITALELAENEWRIDSSAMIARDAMRDVFNLAINLGKEVIVTTDSYYREEQIRQILDKFGLTGYRCLFVSCEYGTSKSRRLFDEVLAVYSKVSILHIGNDESADINPAKARGIESYRVYGGTEMLDSLGGMGLEKHIETLSDRIKLGLLASKMFNDPFVFETPERKVNVSDSYKIGYLIYAPVIIDFVLWLKREFKKQGISQVLFCARDGYLIGRLYRKIDKEICAIYFLTSRVAAIRSGVKTEDDIDFINSMHYSGTTNESVSARFGIDASNIEDWRKTVLQKAAHQSSDYHEYIDKFPIRDNTVGVFDFVAKGTTQFYLQRLFPQHLKGFYFLQPESAYMKEKNLDIQPFFSESERDTSEIFASYYILETVLTSPYPSVDEFNGAGEPVFSEETRSEETLEYVRSAQAGIEDYFDEYLSLVPERARAENKKLDEAILSLIDKLCISDKNFLSLAVEDPFFGRNTAVKDIIG